MEVFGDYAYYYNMFYGDKDYSKEAMQIKLLMERFSGKHNISSVLNLGCGTGRHDFALAEMGFQVTGIDISEDMINIANSNLAGRNNPVFEVADVRCYSPRQKYDAVLSLFHVMSYQCANNDIVEAFQVASEALNSDGLFIFDVWYGPGVLTDLPAVRVKKIEDEKNILIRHANPVMHVEENVVDVHYNILVIDKQTSVTKEINEVHRMRYFFSPEMEVMLKQAGFELTACLDCGTLNKVDFNSWTAYFIAKRK